MNALRRWFDTCYKNRADRADHSQPPVIMCLPASPDELRSIYPTVYEFAFRNGPPGSCPHDRIPVQLMRGGAWMRRHAGSRASRRARESPDRRPPGDIHEAVAQAVGQCMQCFISQLMGSQGASGCRLQIRYPPQGRGTGGALQRLRSSISAALLDEGQDDSGLLDGSRSADEASAGCV